MKKIITVILSFLFITTLAAQNKTTIGLRGGYNFYTIHGRYASGDNFYLRTEDGFHVGADVEFPIGTNVYLQPGILYNQKGANFKNYQYMGQSYHGDVKLSYIEVPVNIIVKPSVGRGRILLGAGGYLGRGIGREAGIEQGNFDVRFKHDVDSSELEETPFYYRPWDAGANFLLGYQFSNNLFLQANGQVGLKRINPTVNGQYPGKNKHRTIGVSLSLGYRF